MSIVRRDIDVADGGGQRMIGDERVYLIHLPVSDRIVRDDLGFVGVRFLPFVVYADGIGLVVSRSAGVRYPHGHIMAGRRLVIEQGAIRDGDFAGGAINRETPAGIVGQGVRRRIACIRIRHRRRADDGAVCGTFRDLDVGQLQIGRRIVDVRQIDRHRLVIGRSAGIRDPHGDVMAGKRLVIELGAVRDSHDTRVGIDGKSSALIINQRVGEGA